MKPDPMTDRQFCDIVIEDIVNDNIFYYHYQRNLNATISYRKYIEDIEEIKDEELKCKFKKAIIKYKLDDRPKTPDEVIFSSMRAGTTVFYS